MTPLIECLTAILVNTVLHLGLKNCCKDWRKHTYIL